MSDGQDHGWLVHSCRLTAFPTSPPGPAEGHDWWLKTLGEEPESATTRPKEGGATLSGTWLSGSLELRIQPFRVDWVVEASDPDSPDLEQSLPIPQLGRLDAFVSDFARFSHDWLSVAPEIARLALGLSLMLPVDNREEGYRTADSFLPSVQLDPVNSRDFTYQINRRRSSTSVSRDLAINRLSKWSVNRMSRYLTHFTDDQASQQLVPYSQVEMVRLELDINTAPENDEPLSHDELHDLVDELIELAKEIAAQGDIA